MRHHRALEIVQLTYALAATFTSATAGFFIGLSARDGEPDNVIAVESGKITHHRHEKRYRQEGRVAAAAGVRIAAQASKMGASRKSFFQKSYIQPAIKPSGQHKTVYCRSVLAVSKNTSILRRPNWPSPATNKQLLMQRITHCSRLWSAHW